MALRRCFCQVAVCLTCSLLVQTDRRKEGVTDQACPACGGHTFFRINAQGKPYLLHTLNWGGAYIVLSKDERDGGSNG